MAFILRVFALGSFPAGFTPDEASFGYDAYSILKTGADQWGNTLPLVLKSFGDNKMPLYGYLSIPSVAIFGLNEFAVRLPNALLGTLAVFATYLMVLEIFKNKKPALLSALLLAISPWHVPLSRGAFEANLTTFFLPLAIYFFYKGLRNKKYLYLSAFAFGLNLFTYHTARLLTPIIVIYLLWEQRSRIRERAMQISIFIFGIFLFVALSTYLVGAGSRAVTSTILSHDFLNQSGQEQYISSISGLAQPFARLFHNKIFFLGSAFVRNYSQYFSWQFLFTDGPAEGTYGMLPGVGALYLFEVLFLIGLVVGYLENKTKLPRIICLWILISVVPAALTTGPGYAANRAAFMMPAIQIVSALGALYLWQNYQKYFAKSVIKVVIIVVVAGSTMFYLENYFFQQPIREGSAMLYGTRALFSSLSQISQNYDHVIISKSISEPQIYLAFYGKISPQEFQNASKNWDYKAAGVSWVDQIPEYSLGKYTFTSLDYIRDSRKPSTLLVGEARDFPESVKPLLIVGLPNGTPQYEIVDPNEK